MASNRLMQQLVASLRMCRCPMPGREKLSVSQCIDEVGCRCDNIHVIKDARAWISREAVREEWAKPDAVAEE